MRRAVICVLLIELLSVLAGVCQERAVKSATNAAGFPHVVAKVSRWQQTEPIKSTTLFTPKGFGLYRVSVVGVVTTPGGSGSWIVAVDWSDSGGQQEITFSGQSNSVGDFVQSTLPFRDLAGVPISFSVTSNGDTAGSKYNLFIVVEQIM